MSVTNLQELEDLIQRVKVAQRQYANFSQEQVDRIFKKAALAANAARIPLAKMTVEETGMGVPGFLTKSVIAKAESFIS
jgi:acetaldehyde dehydrogenase/alcohol dehydrogenase